MTWLLLLAMAAAAPPTRAGCADHWAVELNADSFAHNGAGRKFSLPQLALFHDKVGAKLKAVVGAACRNGGIKPADAKAIKKVVVVSASGATEPHLYAGEDGVLNFEWTFAEENLGIPPAKSIIDGAACWLKPDDPACAAEGD